MPTHPHPSLKIIIVKNPIKKSDVKSPKEILPMSTAKMLLT